METTRGSLAHHRLSFLMPALFEGRPPSGALRISRGSVHRTFWVHDGLLVAESSNVPKEHLAQVLCDLRVIDAPRAAAAFEAAERAGRPLGSFLVERGFVERSRLIEALEHKAREALFDCYTWEAGEFEFCPKESPPGSQVGLTVRLGSLHRDALARQREWAALFDVFPDRATRFHVLRHFAADWSGEEDDQLLTLAEQGAALAELLASGREGPLASGRRLLRLYRRGALVPDGSRGPTVGDSPLAHQVLQRAWSAYLRGSFQEAMLLAGEALDRAPLPEAHALFREAEVRQALVVADRVLGLEGRLRFLPLPRELPASLTTDDLYLYARLKSARSVREAIRSAAMGELAAFRGVERLIDAGLIEVREPSRSPRTLPFGMRIPQV